MNQAWKALPICLSLVFLGSCKSSPEQVADSQPVIFALTVSNIERSMNWYEDHLDFSRDTVMNFPGYGVTVGMMHQGEFYLEFVHFEHGLSPKSLEFPKGATALNGFFKIGFLSTDIERLYNKLSNSSSVKVIAPLESLKPVRGISWPEQHFLLADPDGNYVQFFSPPVGSAAPSISISPFLIASSSQDLDASIHWYEQNLEAQLIDRVGQPGNERAILNKDGLMIELGSFQGYVPLDSLNTPDDTPLSQIHGIRKLTFLVPYIYKPYDRMLQNQIPFDYDLTEQKSMVGDRYFMISDDVGNAIQFFDRDKK